MEINSEKESKTSDNIDQNRADNTIDEQNELNAESPEKIEEVSLEEQYNSLNDSYLRLLAEFDNYRKRTIKEKAEIIKNGGENVIIDILPIVDNLERALKNMETATEIESQKQGIELIYTQLISMLKGYGLKAIETQSTDFNTEFHEAITTITAQSEEEKGKIVDCTLKGYTLNDKVIRHSKVVIGE